MSDGGNKRRRLRARLFARQKGLCYWCGQPMRLMDLRGVKKLHPVPLDMCTIDHLDPRWHPLRGKFNGELRKVAACNACNSARDQVQLRAVPVTLLRAAAERGIKAPLLARTHASILTQIFPLLPSPGSPRGRLAITFESEGGTQNDDQNH